VATSKLVLVALPTSSCHYSSIGEGVIERDDRGVLVGVEVIPRRQEGW